MNSAAVKSPLAFQEYSDKHPHKKGTVGYCGRPSGPCWYVNIIDNSKNHGPGSQQKKNPHEADGNFGRIVSGMDDVVPRIHSVPQKSWLDKKNQVFIFTLVVIYIYHMIIHVRALRMKKSYKRLKKVLDGALNNLRGVPGEGYHDHLFAYSDLGGHILPLSLSTILLRRQHALAVTFQMLVMLILLLYFTLSRIPLHDMEDSEPMIRIDYRGNKVTCRCEACDRQGRRNGKECSFTINSEDGICQLWLCSFEGLSTFLRSTDIKKG